MDRNRGIKAGVNSSEVAFFSLLFNLINFHLSRVGVTINAKKPDDPNIDIANIEKPGKSKANLIEADGADVDETEADGADEPGTGIANSAEADGADADGVDKSDTDTVDPAEADRADKSDTGSPDPEDLAEADRADELDIGIIDLMEIDKTDKPYIDLIDLADFVKTDGTNKPDIGTTTKDSQREPVERRSAEKQEAVQAFRFYFRKVARISFFSLELETFDSPAII